MDITGNAIIIGGGMLLKFCPLYDRQTDPTD